jgi:type II secretory pathway pseudopilin PulG
MLIRRRKTTGDTLIEVLFAVSVFSLVAVSGLAVMNQGSSSSERALEITLVREQMDGQAKTLRFLNSSYVAAFRAGTTYAPSTPAGQWALISANITAHPIINPTALGATSCPTSYLTGSFILNAQQGTFIDPSQGALVPATTFSQVNYISTSGQPVVSSAEGIWIEAIRSSVSADPNQSNIGYIDFHILSCWDSPGQAVPMTLGTIVRLYEPR